MQEKRGAVAPSAPPLNPPLNMWDLPPVIFELSFVITSLLAHQQTTCEVAVHFNKIPHTLDGFFIPCIGAGS